MACCGPAILFSAWTRCFRTTKYTVDIDKMAISQHVHFFASSNGPYFPAVNDVKKLRDATGVSIGRCHVALKMCKGDFEAASHWLRRYGEKLAETRKSCCVTEGLVTKLMTKKHAALLVLKCETDFVSRNYLFKSLLNAIIETVTSASLGDINCLTVADVGELLVTKSFDPKISCSKINDAIAEVSNILGERIVLLHLCYPLNSRLITSSYLHNCEDTRFGRSGGLVSLETEENPRFDANHDVDASILGLLHHVSKQLSIQIVATQPKFLDLSQVDPLFIEKERKMVEESFVSSQGVHTLDHSIKCILENNLKQALAEKTFIDQQYMMTEQLLSYFSRTNPRIEQVERVKQFLRSKDGVSVRDVLHVLGSSIDLKLSIKRGIFVDVATEPIDLFRRS
ncbi:putative elongation factor TS [Cardiosporidium cionae]|uniref:Elongation factor Ts, mitochondrial n=1 Tax=Cardiosporidium cionae TaxID=476202 RepID=A0ABQ7JGB5_9APIC|nr:putative elongation factor TS [Cardiosporidium cionae]|eukprot:KAF8823056.1 putative elongation factor TS [Cardiosporidium cionae]